MNIEEIEDAAGKLGWIIDRKTLDNAISFLKKLDVISAN